MMYEKVPVNHVYVGFYVFSASNDINRQEEKIIFNDEIKGEIIFFTVNFIVYIELLNFINN